MYRLIYLLLFLLLPILSNAQNFKIEGGQIWNGSSFIKKDIYITHGIFSENEISPIDSVINASEKFIVAPFGDFHTHTFDGDYAKRMDTIFLKKGIFFSQDLANNPLGRKKVANYLNQKSTIDVAFANGCLTSNFGHPIEGYERMALGINWPKSRAERAKVQNSRLNENKMYYLIDKPVDVKNKVEMLLSTQPDLIKVILWDGTEYEKIDTVPLFNKGLNPAFLPEIVALGKQYNISVTAHVETEKDLITSIEAGVKRFAHIPYYGYANNGSIDENYPQLSEETLQVLKKHPSVIINPTLYRTYLNLTYLPKQYQLSPDDQQLLTDFHRKLLTDLKNSDVTIAAGADFNNINALDEIIYYSQLNVFSNTELLNILIETSQIIFPNRKIGRIEEGYEANFLILEKNPINSFENVKSIVFKMKNGVIIH